MNQRRASSTRTVAAPTALSAAVSENCARGVTLLPTFLLHALFIAIMCLLSLSQAHARNVNCGQPAGELDQEMCRIQQAYPSAKLFFSYGGSGVTGPGAQSTSAGLNADDLDFSASMTKIVPVFMMLEILANNNQTITYRPTQRYQRNNWSLSTKVRIVEDRKAYQTVGSLGGAAGGGVIYLSKGFASSTCMPNGGWAGIENIAHLSMYTPENGYEYTIEQLLTMAMAASFNDAAVIIGALVFANISGPSNENAILDISEPITAQNGGGQHMRWIEPFRANLTATARDLGARNTTICNPPGWAGTASSGCSARGTAEDWSAIATNAYKRTVDNFAQEANYATAGIGEFFHPSMVIPYSSEIRECAGFSGGRCVQWGSCRNNANVRASSTGAMLTAALGTTASGISPVKLVKTGTIPPPKNMVAVLEPTEDACESQLMTAVVMGLPGNVDRSVRPTILANMFNKGRLQFTGARCGVAFDMSVAVASASTPLDSGMTPTEKAVAATLSGEDLPPEAIATHVLPDPDGENGAGRDDPGTEAGAPSNTFTSTADDEQCDEGIDYAEKWGEDIKAKYNFGLFDRVFESQVDKVFGQQCIGRIIQLYRKVLSTVDTIRRLISSADLMAAVIAEAATAIVKAILDQIFNALTNLICNVTTSITSAIDNISKNLLCFKKPLFGIGKRPFEIPVNIEDISCSGIAINPLYFSGDPNQPLGSGSIAGVNLGGIKSGDRPYFCPLGTKPKTGNTTGGSGAQWTCEPDPNYKRKTPPPAAKTSPSPCPPGQVLGIDDGCVSLTGR